MRNFDLLFRIIDHSVIYDRCHKTAVIPAKAGIQFSNSLRVADNTVFVVLSHCMGVFLIIWIPAFAGMTIWWVLHIVAFVSSAVFNYGKLNKPEYPRGSL